MKWDTILRHWLIWKAWVDDVVAGLISMLPESAAHAEKHVVWIPRLRHFATGAQEFCACTCRAVAFITFGLVKGSPKEIDQETKKELAEAHELTLHRLCLKTKLKKLFGDIVLNAVRLQMFAVTCFICFIGTAVTGNKTRENAKEEEEEAQQHLASMVSMQDVGSTDHMSAFSGKGKGKWSEDRKGKWNDDPQNCYSCGGADLRLLNHHPLILDAGGRG